MQVQYPFSNYSAEYISPWVLFRELRKSLWALTFFTVLVFFTASTLPIMLFKYLPAVATTLALASAIPHQNSILPKAAADFVNQTTCNGKTYTYQNLAGNGFVPADARDKFGDTIGGIGSSIALDKNAWRKKGSGCYTGVLWGLPDRGW